MQHICNDQHELDLTQNKSQEIWQSAQFIPQAVLPPHIHQYYRNAVIPLKTLRSYRHSEKTQKLQKHLLWNFHTAHTRSYHHAVLPATKARSYRSTRKPELQRHLLWKIHTALNKPVQPHRGRTAPYTPVWPNNLTLAEHTVSTNPKTQVSTNLRSYCQLYHHTKIVSISPWYPQSPPWWTRWQFPKNESSRFENRKTRRFRTKAQLGPNARESKGKDQVGFRIA